MHSASGQQNTATIKGSVKDQQGNPIIGATIKITHTNLGTVSNPEGEFQLSGINPGTVEIAISNIGYSKQVKSITLLAGQQHSIDFTLSGGISELQSVEILGRKQNSYKNDYSFSATKTATNIIDIPQSVSTVTKELIGDQQAMRLNDIVKNVTGINQFSTYDDIVMRGFRSSDNRLENGLRTFNNFFSSPLLVNIERVEVIKGPASAIFANTNPGGTINMVTKKPLDTTYKSFSATTGSYNTYRAQADFTGPMNDARTVLYRLNLGYENAETFRDNVGNKSVVIAPSLSFIPRPGTRFNVDLVYSNLTTTVDRGRTIFQNDDNLASTPINFNVSQPGDFLKPQSISLNLSFSQQIGKSGSFNASYKKYRMDETMNEHGFNDYITRDSISMYFTDRVEKAILDNITAYFVQDVKTGKVDHQLLVGYDYGQGNYIQRDRAAVGTADNVADFSLIRPTYYKRPIETYVFEEANAYLDIDQYSTDGVYIQDQLKIGKWQALLSLRQEFYHFPKYSAGNNYGAYYGNSITESLHENALLPKIGLIYSILPRINAYATYSQGFNSQDAGTIGAGDAGGPFKPLTSNLLEGGVKGEFFNRHLFASAAFYQIIENNILVSANDPSNPDLLKQRGQERARGIELEFAGRINANLSVNGGYAFNKNIITKDVEGDPDHLVGQTVENAPKHSSNLWVKYDFKGGDLDGFGLAVGSSQNSRRNTFDANLKLPGYIVFNSALYYKVDHFRLAFNVNNLFNSTFYVGGYSYERNFPGAPRNFLFTTSYTF